MALPAVDMAATHPHRQELIQNGRFPIAIGSTTAWPTAIQLPGQSRDMTLSGIWTGCKKTSILSHCPKPSRAFASATNSRPTVSLTFDDGYAENCDFAIPELIKRRIPTNYFVVSQAVAEGRLFEHDTIAHLQIRPTALINSATCTRRD